MALKSFALLTDKQTGDVMKIMLLVSMLFLAACAGNSDKVAPCLSGKLCSADNPINCHSSADYVQVEENTVCSYSVMQAPQLPH